MNNELMYDQFSDDYDRFVNWEERLKYEIPFLSSEMDSLKKGTNQSVSILDAACGTGHHVIALKNHGFDVAGADISAKMVEIAQRNTHAAGFDIPFKKAGFGQLAESFGTEVFDGLLCLGNSLPHVIEDEALSSSLADFKTVLRPNGKLIIQNRNFDNVLKTNNRWMDPQTFREGSKTWIFTRFYDFDPDGMITFNILILSSKGVEPFKQRVISTRLRPQRMTELTKNLEKSGFVDIQLYGDLHGSAFNVDKSGNLVITARAAN